jgi:hypothetical protein
MTGTDEVQVVDEPRVGETLLLVVKESLTGLDHPFMMPGVLREQYMNNLEQYKGADGELELVGLEDFLADERAGLLDIVHKCANNDPSIKSGRQPYSYSTLDKHTSAQQL